MGVNEDTWWNLNIKIFKWKFSTKFPRESEQINVSMKGVRHHLASGFAAHKHTHVNTLSVNMLKRSRAQIAVRCYSCQDKWLHLISLTVSRRQRRYTARQRRSAPVNTETLGLDKQHGRPARGKAVSHTESGCCDEQRSAGSPPCLFQISESLIYNA